MESGNRSVYVKRYNTQPYRGCQLVCGMEYSAELAVYMTRLKIVEMNWKGVEPSASRLGDDFSLVVLREKSTRADSGVRRPLRKSDFYIGMWF